MRPNTVIKFTSNRHPDAIRYKSEELPAVVDEQLNLCTMNLYEFAAENVDQFVWQKLLLVSETKMNFGSYLSYLGALDNALYSRIFNFSIVTQITRLTFFRIIVRQLNLIFSFLYEFLNKFLAFLKVQK